MLKVFLRGEDSPQRTIPADSMVLSIVLGDANAVGLDTHLVGVDIPAELEPPIEHAFLWSKWSYESILDRYNSDPIGHWTPMKVGAGQGLKGGGIGPYIGPEFALAHRRVEQLLPHSRRKRAFAYGVVKCGGFGAMLGPLPNPTATFSPQEESPSSLLNVLIRRHLIPAIEQAQKDHKHVLIDAVYMCLGANDARTDIEATENHPENAGRHLDELLEALRDALGLEDVPVVASLPLYAEPTYPRKRTDAIRQAFQARAMGEEPFWCVTIDDLEVQQDQVHLTGQAQIGHAYRLCEVWNREVTVLQEPQLEAEEVEVAKAEAMDPAVS